MLSAAESGAAKAQTRMQRRARYAAIFLRQLTLIAHWMQSQFTAAICHLPFAIWRRGRGQKQSPLFSAGGQTGSVAEERVGERRALSFAICHLPFAISGLGARSA